MILLFIFYSLSAQLAVSQPLASCWKELVLVFQPSVPGPLQIQCHSKQGNLSPFFSSLSCRPWCFLSSPVVKALLTGCLLPPSFAQVLSINNFRFTWLAYFFFTSDKLILISSNLDGVNVIYSLITPISKYILNPFTLCIHVLKIKTPKKTVISIISFQLPALSTCLPTTVESLSKWLKFALTL